MVERLAASSKTHTERAIIIGSLKLKESDLILRLLGRKSGKISALARGARRSKRRFMGGLDIFDCGTALLTRPRGDSSLFGLCEFSERETWLGLRDNLRKLALAACCIEICDVAAPEQDPCGGQLFEPLEYSLRFLNAVGTGDSEFLPAAFFAAMFLKLGGWNPLSDRPPTDPRVGIWLTNCLTRNEILPIEPESLAESAFHHSLSLVESHLERRIEARSQL